MVIILVGGGMQAYQQMGKLEDPAFTIKEAKVFTPYPGATPDRGAHRGHLPHRGRHPADGAAQGAEDVHLARGLSEVQIKFKDKYKGPKDFPNIYDELRRKIADAQPNLPPGAGPPRIIDDFADVYGVFYRPDRRRLHVPRPEGRGRLHQEGAGPRRPACARS